MSLARRVLAVAVSITALSAIGCEKKIDAVCEEKCGSSSQACIDANAKAEATAEERGCEGEFEALAECADEKGTCAKGVLDTSQCAAELKALAACVN